MDARLDIINRLNDAQDAIARALEYLEAGELAMAWHVLQNQEQMDRFKGVLAELKKAVPNWQMGGFRSEAAYLDFQRQNAKPK